MLKLLANIKLFVSTAKAKFVFISGRELYDAYLADLSDRDFAISSIFTGVINVDSFLTPEEGQTDIRSMSEWYIANRLIPQEWLLDKEETNAWESGVLKKEIPSLRWYYEYLVETTNNELRDRKIMQERLAGGGKPEQKTRWNKFTEAELKKAKKEILSKLIVAQNTHKNKRTARFQEELTSLIAAGARGAPPVALK